MTIQKDKKPWQGFDFDLNLLLGFLPHDWDACASWQLDNRLFSCLANLLEGLDKWLTSIESRLQSLQDHTLVIGWEDIADIVGVHKRTLQRPKYKKKLLQRGIIEYALIGDPPRKRIVGLPSRLVQERHRLRKKRKT